MQHRSFAWAEPIERLGEHALDHGRQRSLRDLVRDDLAVIQIHHRRQIQLSIVDLELRHVRHPFLVRLIGPEVTLQMVGCRLGNCSCKGLVAFGSNQRFQLHRNHQLLHGLVVDTRPLSFQLSSYSPIAVPAAVTIEDVADPGLQVAVSVARVKSLLLVVKAAACQPGNLQQIREWEVLPQLEHDQRPLAGTERVLARVKACAFFR